MTEISIADHGSSGDLPTAADGPPREIPVAECQRLFDFPQAFTHVSLINTAHNLSRVTGPAKDRQRS